MMQSSLTVCYPQKNRQKSLKSTSKASSLFNSKEPNKHLPLFKFGLRQRLFPSLLVPKLSDWVKWKNMFIASKCLCTWLLRPSFPTTGCAYGWPLNTTSCGYRSQVHKHIASIYRWKKNNIRYNLLAWECRFFQATLSPRSPLKISWDQCKLVLMKMGNSSLL